MTSIELNNKYKKNIEEGFTGVENNFDSIGRYIDRLLRMLLYSHPDFKLKQIKMKCGEVVFYSNLHEIYKDDDRQRDYNISMKIKSRLMLLK
jgi:hypothetical protein